ncbi:MAG: Crp/Fnr family transcriptional regulator [Chloroflexia bacterium]|nr:Crp/Fnr family transcriptional regulator [Chloroflexia bacterium]
MSQERWRFLTHIPIFAGMEEEELARIAADMQRKRCRAGENLFYQGDRGDALYIVESGLVRIYVLSEEGQEVSVVLCSRGDFFGELALLDEEPRSATAVAMEETTLWVLSRPAFFRHLRENYTLALNLMHVLSARVRRTTEEFKSMATLDVSQRIIRKLLELARWRGRHTDRGLRIRGQLTQQELASLVGSSRESTNRALRALERQGLIDMEQGRILLLKPEELRNMVYED